MYSALLDDPDDEIYVVIDSCLTFLWAKAQESLAL